MNSPNSQGNDVWVCDCAVCVARRLEEKKLTERTDAPHSALIKRLLDKDAIVIHGLFHCIPAMREAAEALSTQQPVGTVEEVTHAYGTKVKWERKMVAGEVLYTSPTPAPVSPEAIELAKMMLLPRYTDQDGKKVAAEFLRVAGI